MGSSEHHIVHPRVSPWGLTQREAEVMDALCKHGSSKKIALAINMGDETVKSRLQDIYDKMRCRERVVIACKWQRWRIETTPQP